MVDIANYRFADPMAGVQRGYEFGNALRQDSARQRAGNALKGGDYAAASGELYGAGMLDEGSQVQTYGQGQQDRVTNRQKELLKYTADAAGRLSEFHRSSGDINRTLAAFDQMAPQFQQYGETPEEIAQVRAQLQVDPDATLVALGAGAAKQLGYEIRSAGDEVLVFQGGQLVNRYRGAKTVNVAEGGEVNNIAGDGQVGTDQPQVWSGRPSGAPPTEVWSGEPPAGAVDPDGVWAAIIQRESGGNGNAVGPETPYGRAQGSTQMLMGTAEAMARKLGVPWNPSLMRGDSPRALEYQNRLGRAYFDEGLEKSGGDVRQAAMFYHGGPNQEIWGPKTRAYADAVAGGSEPYQVAANGETPPPPGTVTTLYRRPKAPKEQAPPSGYRWGENGSLAPIPGGPADPATQATTNAKNTRKAAADLRKEFNQRPEVKEYREVATSFNQIRQLFSGPPTAASDIAGIFSYMKMLDPGSVVREGEFATAQNAAGVPEQLQNLYNRALNGQRLNPKQRADFLAQARSIHDTRQSRYGEIVGEYRGYASDYDINPDEISRAPGAGEGKAKPAGWSRNLPPAQRQAAMQFKGSTAAAGSAQNPSLPTDEAEYRALPSGTHYIHSSGKIKVKP